ncbi:methyl-accepting chemotaxis protein [Salipiger sp.]|uniref:methyl-accepting chemotaxis protein n=1 Tax=Salipiger sp. TaxID=2078585 RepID=UPI003A97AF3E
MKPSDLGYRLSGAFQSVFLRIALLLGLSTVVVASIMGWQSLRLLEQVATRGIAQLAEESARAESVNLVDHLRFQALDRIAAAVETTLGAGQESLGAVLVIGADGTVVAEGGAPEADRAMMMELVSRALQEDAMVTGDRGLVVAAPVTRPGLAAPVGAYVMRWSNQAFLDELSGRKLLILVTAGAAFVVMMVLTLLMMRRIVSRPMRALDGAMTRVAEGDYESEVPLRGRRDEFGRLATHLSELVAALVEGRQAEGARLAAHEAQARVVQHLSKALDRLAEGALTHMLSDPFPAEYEELRENYNRAVESLHSAVAEVSSSAQNISSSAEEIARGSDDLSQRTETQAATLEQTAAALDELLSSVKEAAERAREVKSSVDSASSHAERNGEVMNAAVAAMAGIEKSSEQIGEIISVIDDIAFQTNLLALNAGVEAARAGASGKGFAVVASEVRALAQRSSDAAQQIKTLISGSTDQVKEGAQLVEQAGQALDEVVTQVRSISGLVTDIATVSAEQAQGLNEINVGVTNLDRVTQQNAAMVEESTAAAHMLRNDASRLSELMERFETAAPGRTAAPRRVA